MNLPTVDLSTVQTPPPAAQTAAANNSESANSTSGSEEGSTAADFQALMAALKGRVDALHNAGTLKPVSTTTTSDPARPQELRAEPLPLLLEEETTAQNAVASEEKTPAEKSDEESSVDGLNLPLIGTLLPPITPPLTTAAATATASAAAFQSDQNDLNPATDLNRLIQSKSGLEQTVQTTHASGLSNETSQSGSEQQFMDELKNLLAMIPGAHHQGSSPTADAQTVTPLAQSIGFTSQDGTAMTALAPSLPHSSPGDTATAGKTEPPPSRFLLEQPLRLNGDSWVDGLADRILWASKNQFHYAEIQLDPPELGALQVRIQIHQDQAQVQFVSPHHQVREAIEGSLDRLRDLFQQQGMQLAHSQVADGGGRGNAQQESSREGWRSVTVENPTASEEPSLQPRALREGALIDRYA